jgi:hypothetical protein
MLIECNHCEGKVDAKVLAQVESSSPDEPFPFRSTFLLCPVCQHALLAGEEKVQTGEDRYEWTNPVRLWPEPRHHIDWSIPPIVRVSLEEAQICFRAKAYSACVVMCGRALEGIMVHYTTKSQSLAAGLSELKAAKIIDERLFEWGDELRRIRNLGAHASDQQIDRDDAKDVLDFTNAICEYVFVLTARFKRFLARKDKSAA